MMATTNRVAQLRQQSLDAVPALSGERAELMTEFYRPAELIVGEKGPAPKAAPTYSELDGLVHLVRS